MRLRMKTQSVPALMRKGQALPIQLGRKQLLQCAYHALHAKGMREYRTFENLEDVARYSDADLRALPVADTIMEPVADAFALRGKPPIYVLGELMDLGFTRDDLHAIACGCHEQSDVMLAHTAASAVIRLMDTSG
jgi:hypothetical protein